VLGERKSNCGCSTSGTSQDAGAPPDIVTCGGKAAYKAFTVEHSSSQLSSRGTSDDVYRSDRLSFRSEFIHEGRHAGLVRHGDKGTAKILHSPKAGNEYGQIAWRDVHRNKNKWAELSLLIEDLICHARRSGLCYRIADQAEESCSARNMHV